MIGCINIHDEITAVCGKLGLDPNDVGEIVVRPLDVQATVFKRNKHGRFFVGDDSKPAKEILTFAVRTS